MPDLELARAWKFLALQLAAGGAIGGRIGRDEGGRTIDDKGAPLFKGHRYGKFLVFRSTECGVLPAPSTHSCPASSQRFPLT